MRPEIIKNGSKITIQPFSCPKGIAPEITIDLAPYANKLVRIWLDEDMTYSVDKHKDHYWQIAEMRVPYQRYTSVDTGKIDKDGRKIEQAEKVPIELLQDKIELWDIEEKMEVAK